MDVNSVKISQPGTYSTKDTASVKKEKKEMPKKVVIKVSGAKSLKELLG